MRLYVAWARLDTHGVQRKLTGHSILIDDVANTMNLEGLRQNFFHQILATQEEVLNKFLN